MLYNSTFFITVFFPLVFAGWYLLQKLENPAFAKLFMIGMSLWFYGYYNLSYLWILLVSLAFNYGISLLLARFGGCAGGVGKGLLAAGLAGNLGMLFYFKYFNFFVDNCNYFLHADIHLEQIALPLGISFFTFQQISFLVERYRGNAPCYGLLDYMFFISFFPQLVAGPIVLHSDLIPQLQKRENRRPEAEKLYTGAGLFIMGLAKKVLLADSLAVPVNAEYNNIAALDTPAAWVVISFYMLELYFDFSGYSDMSRGLGRMLGFELPENFNAPLRAVSVKDFWRRWHMTLSNFLMQYVYIPLGGNRRGRARQCVNLFAVFLVSGFWHGANWTFVVWGMLHGAAVVFETLFPRLRFRHEWLNRLVTAVYVTLTFSIFRSDSLASACLLWKKLFTAGNRGMLLGMCNTLRFPENYALGRLLEMVCPRLLNPMYVACLLLLCVVSAAAVMGKKAEQWVCREGRTYAGTLCMAFLFVWAFLSLSRVSVFLYFNF